MKARYELSFSLLTKSYSTHLPLSFSKLTSVVCFILSLSLPLSHFPTPQQWSLLLCSLLSMEDLDCSCSNGCYLWKQTIFHPGMTRINNDDVMKRINKWLPDWLTDWLTDWLSDWVFSNRIVSFLSIISYLVDSTMFWMFTYFSTHFLLSRSCQTPWGNGKSWESPYFISERNEYSAKWLEINSGNHSPLCISWIIHSQY